MKQLTVTVLLIMPTLASAQNYPGMNQLDMQKIQQMQSCMEKVDQGKLQTLEQRHSQFDAEIKSLCASNNRDEAQKKAISFAKEIMNNAAIQDLRKCGEIAKGMMPEISFMDLQKEIGNHHVCDSY